MNIITDTRYGEHFGRSFAHADGAGWHGIGKGLNPKASAAEIREAAGFDFAVEKRPAQIIGRDGRAITIPNTYALVRSDNESPYPTTVGKDWEPVQPGVATEFFDSFVQHGDLSYVAAGLTGNKLWIQAKLNDGVALFGGKDVIQPYFLFTSTFKNGVSTVIKNLSTRLFCLNQIESLTSDFTRAARFPHVGEKRFTLPEARRLTGLAKVGLQRFHKSAELLAAKPAPKDGGEQYFKEVYDITEPNTGDDRRDRLQRERNQRTIDRLKETVLTQPGAEYGEGTLWALLNAVTYDVDHGEGCRGDAIKRQSSAWFGTGAQRKEKALTKALDLARA